MALVQQSSPHAHNARPTSRVMLWVILAALPGLLAQTLFFGWGNLINVVWCIALALAAEAAILKLRSKPVAFCCWACPCRSLPLGGSPALR